MLNFKKLAKENKYTLKLLNTELMQIYKTFLLTKTAKTIIYLNLNFIPKR